MSIRSRYSGAEGMKRFGQDMALWAAKWAKERPVKAITKVCALVTAEAKRRCPVEFGTLRQSIGFEVKERKGVVVGAVGTDIEYAPYVEFGTKTIRVGTPSAPRTSWPAKAATGATRETMPYLRAAVYAKRAQVTRLLKEVR